MAEIYGVDRHMFAKVINGKYKLDSKRLFSDIEEKILIMFIKLRAILAQPMTLIGFQIFVREFLSAKHEKKINEETDPEILSKLRSKPMKAPSHWWMRSFYNRHNDDLVKKIGKIAHKQRVAKVSRETIDDFYNLLEIIFKQTGLSLTQETLEDSIRILRKITFNCDETGISLKPKQLKFLLPRGDFQSITVCNKNTFEYTTVLVCGNAFGDLLDPLIIYRGLPKGIPEELKSWEGPIYRHTKSGWINTELFNEWFEKVFIVGAQSLRPDGYDGPIILLFDGHSTHLSEDLLRCAANNNVLLLRLPPNTTHLLQPLDRSFFGPLKAILSQIIRRIIGSEEKTSLTLHDFAPILKEAWERMSGSGLRRGFAISGILTDTGINRNAISDETLAPSFAHTERGAKVIQYALDELEELAIPPETDPEMHFILTKMTKTLTTFTKPSSEGSKTISLLLVHYLFLIFFSSRNAV